jgi:hypothetical protein
MFKIQNKWNGTGKEHFTGLWSLEKGRTAQGKRKKEKREEKKREPTLTANTRKDTEKGQKVGCFLFPFI